MKSDNFITDGDALMCLAFLSHHPLFSTLPTDALLKLISSCVINSYAVGEIIVQEGELVDAIYFIIRGQCEVTKQTFNTSGEPTEQPIATLREEESIGLSEAGLFSASGNRTATIKALSEVRTLRLGITLFQGFLQERTLKDEAFSHQLAMLMRMHFIKTVAPFASISNQNIKHIANQIEEKSFPSGATLFQQGDPGDACYIVASGKVEISVSSGANEKKILAELEQNAIFGELAIMHDSTRMATAKTTDPTTVLVINKSLFKEITQQNIKAHEALMQLQMNHCHPVKLKNIEVYRQKNTDGVEISILKNPALGTYMQLSDQELFLWNSLDGESSIHEVTIQYFLHFRVLNVEDIAAQIMNLSKAGFVHLHHDEIATSINNLAQQQDAIVKLRKKLEYKIIFENTDEWVGKLFQRFGWIFYTKPAVILGALIAIAGFAAFVIHFNGAVGVLGDSPHKWGLFALAVLLVVLCTPLYQLAHAFTTKYYGRKVRSFGLGWSGFAPFAYCDTSDMWLSPKKQRICVDLAGVYLSAVLAGLAGLADFFISPSYPSLIFFLELVAFGFYVMVIANLDTAFERDGYYALIDALEKPNLRLSSIKWSAALFSNKQIKLNLIWINIKHHHKEVVYWICTLLNLVLIHMIVPYIMLTYLLMGLFGLNNVLLVSVLTLVIFILSSLSLYKDFFLRVHSSGS